MPFLGEMTLATKVKPVTQRRSTAIPLASGSATCVASTMDRVQPTMRVIALRIWLEKSPNLSPPKRESEEE